MQREICYNLRNSTYFHCLLLFSKEAKLCAICSQHYEKVILFYTNTKDEFLLHFYHLIRFTKNEIYHKTQREKIYNLSNKTYYNCSKTKQNSVLPILARSKCRRSKFYIIEKQKVRL